MPTTPEPLITLPLDLTIDGSILRVTQIREDAVVFHYVADFDGSLTRTSDDLPVAGMAFTDTLTVAELTAHIVNPPAPVAPVPASVPLWAFRQVLIEDGLLDTILAAVAGNAVVKNFLEYGNYVDRSSPALAQLAASLGKTDAEVDDFFRRAAALKL